MLQFSRHEWQPYAHEHVIPENPNDPTHYVFAPADPSTFPQGQRIFFRWLVLGGGPNDVDTIYAETPDREFRIGCAPGQDVEDLKADQQGVLARVGSLRRLDNDAHVAQLGTQGYSVLTHGFASTKEMGVAFARTEALQSSRTPRTSRRPPARRSAAFRPRRGSSTRGWHEVRGSFTATPPQESVSGTATMTSAPQRNFPPAWHPRVWDVHMWLDGGDLPALRIIHPNRDIPGWSPDGVGFFEPHRPR